MQRDYATGASCFVAVAGLVISGIIFLTAVCARTPAQRSRLFGMALVFAIAGALAFAALGLITRSRSKALEALAKRADGLRRERERLRALEARPAQPVAQPARAIPPRATAVPPPPKPTRPEPKPALVAGSIAVARAKRDIGACPICQTKVLAGEEYLTCPACKTPYHKDCWEYNRGCGVYGCTVRIGV